MRTILYTVSLLALSLSAHAFAAETSYESTCDDSLKARMKQSPTRQAECEVTITNGEDTVTKTYRAALVGDSAAEAQLALQEFCETCGTEGPVQKYAIQWNDLTNQIFKNLAAQANKSGAPDAGSPAVAGAAKNSKEDVMSNHLATLNKALRPDEATIYYQNKIEPEMQRLAQSTSEADRILLRRVILTFYSGVQGPATQSPVLRESVEQFNKFAAYKESLARINLDAQRAAQFPQNQRAIEIARMQTLGQAEAYFRNRAMLLRQMNVNDPKLLRNAEVLLAALKQGDASPAATGLDINGQPRGQYGAPGGLQNGGIAPRQVTNGRSIFHAN